MSKLSEYSIKELAVLQHEITGLQESVTEIKEEAESIAQNMRDFGRADVVEFEKSLTFGKLGNALSDKLAILAALVDETYDAKIHNEDIINDYELDDIEKIIRNKSKQMQLDFGFGNKEMIHFCIAHPEQKLLAVKTVKEKFGVGLREAKNWCDEIWTWIRGNQRLLNYE